ncbi:MAG: hypothetical protein ACD_78C00238G0001 [uncultured bacterium (gcode 4)]|uniref:Uncharacterized protein n=1 Tax=uncultured bacterium (gcode 4) TaxID=1234023 RepID=K1XHP6_9BACT|nr:MAG: hypothetical protein ACD_78C00238G0001 [uncultured bacterium (gcode 4)]
MNVSVMYKKADVVVFEWTPHYIMAVLSWWEEEVTYNICNTELLWPKFWIKLWEDCLVPSHALAETIRTRARCFL